MSDTPQQLPSEPSITPTKKSRVQSTQRFLPVAEIRDDMVLMKDGTLRQILLVSSLNFDLKTDQEQGAIIQGYIQMLNGLTFPLQVVIQSRRLNISDYLDRLKEVERDQQNELLRMQTLEYRQYVSELVEIADIMSKRFFVVVPYSTHKSGVKSFWVRVKELFQPARVIKIQEKQLEKYREELDRRVDLVRSGLESIGLKTELLDTQALIELMYESYNPHASSNELLTGVNNIRVED